ncbi:ubiquitin-like protein [Mollisia scopiformis]|uniref:Ubiquitin-like protein n=1 Tax=Mollisia scopiformis TaxID=149040 RepID=A0A194X249_MOLSC|nr:ubiquitin-like protein [Mollisia scopiformis]KUJ13917.1 ubiquitin-like protein [Mollisia scopiformis]
MTTSNASGSPPPDAPKPEETPTTPKQVMSIKIKDQSENETFFRIKPSTNFNKVFKAYAEKRSIELRSIRFLFHGVRVQDFETPEKLEMGEGDEIQAMVEQQGGDGTPAAGAGAGAADTPADQDAPKYLNVKVVDQSRNEVFFKIKMHTPLKKVMDAYCERQSIRREDIRFVLEGERITDNDTPLSKEMEDGDSIEVFREQTGGNGGEEGAQEKPKDEGAKATINIKLMDQNRNDTTYRVKLTTKMEKVMNTFANQQGQLVDSLRFFTPDGKRIIPTDTPESLALEDEDVVDVHLHQEGGAADQEESTKKNMQISVSVKGSISGETFFKANSNTVMKKLMTHYAIQAGKNLDSLSFFNSERYRIREEDTLASLGLENGDFIFVEEAKVNLSVMDRYGAQVGFVMKSKGKMSELMDCYCRHQGQFGLQFWTTGGRQVNPSDTPYSLGLIEGDVLSSSYDLQQVEKHLAETLVIHGTT